MAAGGGKPLAEASVRLSVEGAPQVQSALKQTAKDAQVAGGAMGTMDAQTKKASASFTSLGAAVKSASQPIRRTTQAFTGIVSTATAAAGAIFAVANAIKVTIEYFDTLTNGAGAAEKFLKTLGDVVPKSGDEAAKQLDTLRDRIEQVNAELADSLANPLDPRGRLRSTIQEELKDLQARESALVRRVAGDRKATEAKEQEAAAQKILTALAKDYRTEEEKLRDELVEIDSLMSKRLTREQGALALRTKLQIAARLNEIAAEKRAKEQADAEVIAERERKEREAAEERIRDAQEEARMRAEALKNAERNVTDSLRSRESSELKAIAVDIQQIPHLMRIIAAKEGGRVWR